jgi:hypothetical protein
MAQKHFGGYFMLETDTSRAEYLSNNTTAIVTSLLDLFRRYGHSPQYQPLEENKNIGDIIDFMNDNLLATIGPVGTAPRLVKVAGKEKFIENPRLVGILGEESKDVEKMMSDFGSAMKARRIEFYRFPVSEV